MLALTPRSGLGHPQGGLGGCRAMEQKALCVLTNTPLSAPGVSLRLCEGPAGLGRSTQLTASPYASWRGQHVPNPVPQHQAHSPVLRGAWVGPPVQVKDGTKPALSV